MTRILRMPIHDYKISHTKVKVMLSHGKCNFWRQSKTFDVKGWIFWQQRGNSSEGNLAEEEWIFGGKVTFGGKVSFSAEKWKKSVFSKGKWTFPRKRHFSEAKSNFSAEKLAFPRESELFPRKDTFLRLSPTFPRKSWLFLHFSPTFPRKSWRKVEEKSTFPRKRWT